MQSGRFYHSFPKAVCYVGKENVKRDATLAFFSFCKHFLPDGGCLDKSLSLNYFIPYSEYNVLSV